MQANYSKHETKGMMPKVLILENSFNDLVISRFSLGSYLEESGFNINYSCPNPEAKEVFNVQMSRNSLAPIQLTKGVLRLSKLETNLKLDSVLSFRLIPNVLNYFASFNDPSIKRLAVITGLGYSFISTNNSFISRVQRWLIKEFYRVASKRVQIIAQNPDDLKDLGILNGKVILGSGVGTEFKKEQTEFSISSINLLFVGRLLKSKGILDAIEIFKQVKSNFPKSRFKIVGALDEKNPDSLDNIELNQLLSIDGVEYHGYLSDMDSIYAESNVLIFPSVYREGIPRVIIESLKYGLTIITKDMPGCRETVIGNGYLMNHSNCEQGLIEYIKSLSPEKLWMNHEQSIRLFKEVFSAEVIYPQYRSILLNQNSDV